MRGTSFMRLGFGVLVKTGSLASVVPGFRALLAHISEMEGELGLIGKVKYLLKAKKLNRDGPFDMQLLQKVGLWWAFVLT